MAILWPRWCQWHAIYEDRLIISRLILVITVKVFCFDTNDVRFLHGRHNIFCGFGMMRILTLLLVLCGGQVMAQEQCVLSLVENRPFMAFANMRVQKPVNELSRSVKHEVLYLVYVKKTGTYSGVSIFLDDSFKVDSCIRFSYNSKAGFQKMEQPWQADTLALKNLFIDEACYMNDNYKSEGTDELLLCRKPGVTTNGIIYKGCATSDPDTESSVQNKTLLAVLKKFRSQTTK